MSGTIERGLSGLWGWGRNRAFRTHLLILCSRGPAEDNIDLQHMGPKGTIAASLELTNSEALQLAIDLLALIKEEAPPWVRKRSPHESSLAPSTPLKEVCSEALAVLISASSVTDSGALSPTP